MDKKAKIIVGLFFTMMILGMSSNPVYLTKSDDYHIVEKNDTILSISQKYSLSIEKIKLFNNLKSDKIYVGQKIYLYPQKPSKNRFVTVCKIPQSGIHIVKPKETVHHIAKMYNLSILEILDYNELVDYQLKIGMRIKLNATTQNEKNNIFKKEKREPQKIEKKETKEAKQTSKSELFLPLRGTVTSEFGLRNGLPHKGIDIAAPIGEPIYACLAGQVVYAGKQRGYGNVVILKHVNYAMSVYAHNDANFVRLGENVKRGQPIASVGETGVATGSHLHFEYRENGTAINPRKVLPKF